MLFPAVQQTDISAHGMNSPENTVAAVVDAHIADQYLGIRNQKSGGDEIGSGRDISRHFYFLADQMRFGLDR